MTCIVIFGGGFDPVHMAHVTLAKSVVDLLKPEQLRIIPTGLSKAKAAYQAAPSQRIAMLSLAFAELAKTTPLIIDEQEIKRAEQGQPSYSVDTLTELRHQFGPTTSLVLLMGADQLQQLQHWNNWRNLFELAHIVVATRPEYQLDDVNISVANEFKQRHGSIEQLKNKPYGYAYLCADLAIDVSSTQVRIGNQLTMVPPDVLNYIQQHHLYQHGH